MKLTRIFLPLLFLAAACPAGNFRFSEVQIPMRDGKTLAADVFVPMSGEKTPTILIQTPYGKSAHRPWFQGQGRYGAKSLFTDPRYSFVIVDWRGKNASKDAAIPGKPQNLVEDGFDTVAWVAKQEWSNGKVGTWGASALGRAQFDTASSHPPALVCAVPIVMSLNMTYDTYFPGGAAFEEYINMLTRLGFNNNMYTTVTAHPSNDVLWHTLAKDYVRPEDIQVPMLFMGGWYDIFTDGVIDAFTEVRAKGGEKAREGSRLLMGPYVHAADTAHNGDLDFPAAELYSIHKAADFFGHWLLGENNEFAQPAPAVLYYQMGEDEWKPASQWPPAKPESQHFYLAADKRLDAAKPKQAEDFTIRFDPANPVPTVGGHLLDPTHTRGPADQRAKVESRNDVLVFSTPVLKHALVIDGKPMADLFVSSDRTDTDFTVLFNDVYPDGRSMLIGEGIRRMRYRESTSAGKMMKPGEIYRITVELPNTALTLPAGHAIRAVVSSSDYPKFAVNPNDGGKLYDKHAGVVATNHIYASSQRPSALILPVENPR
jgi:hypothetical protein